MCFLKHIVKNAPESISGHVNINIGIIRLEQIDCNSSECTGIDTWACNANLQIFPDGMPIHGQVQLCDPPLMMSNITDAYSHNHVQCNME